jgi:hypothetical protein
MIINPYKEYSKGYDNKDTITNIIYNSTLFIKEFLATF